MNKKDRVIINSPYSEPTYYWSYERENRLFDKLEARRQSGFNYYRNNKPKNINLCRRSINC